jgi:hypothetical protein
MNKLKPLETLVQPDTGDFILVPSPNFGYKTIPLGYILKVPEYQEMVLLNEIILDGNLFLEGDLTLIS